MIVASALEDWSLHAKKMEESAKDFWKRDFANFEAPQFFAPPPDYLPTASATFEHCVWGLRWPSVTTISMLVQAACSILISQYSNSCDVSFGLRAEIVEDGIVPVRVQFHWNQSLGQLFEKIHLLTIERRPFLHLGLEHIFKLNESTERASANHACRIWPLR